MMAFIKDGYSYRNNASNLKFLSSESLQNVYYFNSSPNVATYGKILSHFRDEGNDAKETGQMDLRGGEKIEAFCLSTFTTLGCGSPCVPVWMHTAD